MEKHLSDLATMAGKIIRTAIDHAPERHGAISYSGTVWLDGRERRIVMIGAAHRYFDDGHAYVLLDPDDVAATALEPNVAYVSAEVRRRMRQRCSAVLNVWVQGSEVRPVVFCRRRGSRGSPD